MELLVLGNDIFEKEERECLGIAVSYIYRCIGMNAALECSPNYPHTRLSTITRSHVRDSDFRLITKEVKTSDTNIVFEESSVDSSVGREQKEARAHLARLERRQLRLMLNGGAISWKSKRQGTVSLSSAESEYIAASKCSHEVTHDVPPRDLAWI